MLRRAVQIFEEEFDLNVLAVIDAPDEVAESTVRNVFTLMAAVKTKRPTRFVLFGRPSTISDNYEAARIDLNEAVALRRRLERLSSSAQKAFCWAEGMRRAQKQDEVRGEYLLAGLLFMAHSSARSLLTLFEDYNTIWDELIGSIDEAVGRGGRASPVQPASARSLSAAPLSVEVEEVLQAAESLADAKKSPEIRMRHLLGGLLSVPGSNAAAWIERKLEVPSHRLYRLIAQARDAKPPLNLIWRESSRRPLHLTLRGHEMAVTALEFDRNKPRLYSGSKDGHLHIWETGAGEPAEMTHAAVGMALSRNIDGPVVAISSTAANDRRVLVAYGNGWLGAVDKRQGEFTDIGAPLPQGCAVAAWSNEGFIALTAAKDSPLTAWNLDTGAKLFELTGHSGHVNGLAVTSDGRRAVSVSSVGEIFYWDLQAKTSIRSFSASKDPYARDLWSVAILPDGQSALTGAGDGALKLWNLETGERKATLLSHTAPAVSPIVSIAPFPDGRRAATASGFELKLWDLESRRSVTIARGRFGAVAVAPDGLTLAAGRDDGAVLLFDVPALLESQPAEAAQGYSVSISATPSEATVGQTVRVRVELLPVAPGSGGVELPVGQAPLYCFINCEDPGLRVNGDEVAPINADPVTNRPYPVAFELQAYLLGERQFNIFLFAEDPAEGRVRLYESSPGRVSVSPLREDEEPAPVLPSVELRVAPRPDLTLTVKTELPEGERHSVLTYYLSSRVAGLQMHDEKVGRAVLSADALARLRALLAQTLRRANACQPADSRQYMLSFGSYLFNLLFPRDTAAAFREALGGAWASAQARTLLFADDGVTWLPWELLAPGPEMEAAHGSFICERFSVGRWVSALGRPPYGEVPLGEVALSHYKTVAAEGRDEELEAWGRLLRTPHIAAGIAQVVRPETQFFGMHLLRHADTAETRREIVRARGGDAGARREADEAREARLDLRMKRPVITLGILGGDESDVELSDGWPLPERVMLYLRGGASAVLGPWWPTCEEADRVFWVGLYEGLARGLALGEAARRSRLAVREALPARADWLAYTLFGDPRAHAYAPEVSEGYTMLEQLWAGAPLRAGETCHFRVSISSRPPLVYEDRLVRAEALPQRPTAVFLVPDLQRAAPVQIEMTPFGRTMVQATYAFTPERAGDYLLIARLYDGDERLQSLQLDLTVEPS